MKMPRLIEDYALIGDLHTAALVSRSGSIEWLCVPRFDSDGVFASLLGDERNGCWTLRPAHDVLRTERRYRNNTLVLETTLHCREGSVRVIDFMPRRRENGAMVVRIVEGIGGSCEMETSLVARFAFGSLPPWTRPHGDCITLVIGPDGLALRASVPLEARRPDVSARFRLTEGKRETFVLEWFPSHEEPPPARDAVRLLHETEERWRSWAADCSCTGWLRDDVLSSIIVLKALTYEPTGGCVAAPTTSLPEDFGGSLNWDYRYAWIRDSAFTIEALIVAGLHEEARAWRDWLLRVLGGKPERLQIMYSVGGDRRLAEYEADWLRGFEASRPVRIGNAAYTQFQLGIYGQLMHAMYITHRDGGIELDAEAWTMLVKLIDHVCEVWQQPDSGIWEYREPAVPYTVSRAMAWAAVDRAIRFIEREGFDGPLERWRATRDAIHTEVCTNGFHRGRNAFVQSYGSEMLDASVLLIPIMEFLPADDERVRSTLAALERELIVDGLIMRDSRFVERDALGNRRPKEGAFLACNLWLVQNYVLAGRLDDARDLLARVRDLSNDLGLFSEEYDVRTKRMAGNFPQTFSHATFVNAAIQLLTAEAASV